MAIYQEYYPALQAWQAQVQDLNRDSRRTRKGENDV
jgi:hypothetical protein